MQPQVMQPILVIYLKQEEQQLHAQTQLEEYGLVDIHQHTLIPLILLRLHQQGMQPILEIQFGQVHIEDPHLMELVVYQLVEELQAIEVIELNLLPSQQQVMEQILVMLLLEMVMFQHLTVTEGYRNELHTKRNSRRSNKIQYRL